MNIDSATGRVIRDDLTGKRFGTVTVQAEYELRSNGGCKWRYVCDCGGEGWAWAEVLKRQPNFTCKECRKAIIAKARTTHGGRYTKKYQVWRNMKDRCENPDHKSYKDYGGRGITVCERWHDYALFDADTGVHPEGEFTIDRIENNRGYEPENTRWATHTEQMNNRRCNRFLTFNGKTQTWIQWSRELGIDKTTIRKRALKGWPVEKILSTSDFR